MSDIDPEAAGILMANAIDSATALAGSMIEPVPPQPIPNSPRARSARSWGAVGRPCSVRLFHLAVALIAYQANCRPPDLAFQV